MPGMPVMPDMLRVVPGMPGVIPGMPGMPGMLMWLVAYQLMPGMLACDGVMATCLAWLARLVWHHFMHIEY